MNDVPILPGPPPPPPPAKSPVAAAVYRALSELGTRHVEMRTDFGEFEELATELAAHMQWVREIEDGKAYLIGLPPGMKAESADYMRRVLERFFPNATFAFIAGGVPVDVTEVRSVVNEPIALAVETAAAKARDRAEYLATNSQSETAKAGYTCAATVLARFAAELATELRGLS